MGYCTALIPVSINDDFVQYHLVVSKSGQINLSHFSKELESAVSILDMATLQARHCFIGWCGEVDVRLGTAEYIKTSQPRLSGLQKKERSLHLSGLSLGMGMATAAPVQIGPSVQISGVFVTNKVNFTYAGVYSQLLRDSTREMALLYDAEAKRSWIVSKLSLLLYMCHRHVIDRGDKNRVPNVPGHTNPADLWPLLDGQGELVVYGESPSELRLRTLMTGLNANLLSTAQNTEEAGRASLYGYEFFDIVNSPGSGAWMRKAKIGTASGNWVGLAAFVDTIVFGAGFGDVIKPSTSSWCQNIDPTCVTVPSGANYLTMPVHCINQLLQRLCGKIVDSETQYIELADGVYWIVSGLDFQRCCATPDGSAGCWRRNETFQRLESTKLRRTITKPRAPLLQLPVGGAIVFGRPVQTMFWKARN
jgi:hypothetical protein